MTIAGEIFTVFFTVKNNKFKHRLTMAASTAAIIVSAALLAATQPPNTGSIQGTVHQADGKTPATNRLVFFDFNRDGVQEPATEYGVNTDAKGNYSFGNLPPGVYPVQVLNGPERDYVIGQPTFTGANFTLPAPVATPANTTTTTAPTSQPTKTTVGMLPVPPVVDNKTVTLLPNKVYVGPIVFNGHKGATLDANGSTIFAPNPTGTLNTGYACTFWYDSDHCTLKNATLTSVDAAAVGCKLRGSNIGLVNVNLANLAEGVDGDGLTNLTVTGLRETGPVGGRCLFLLGCNGLDWSNSYVGYATKQSPVRFSYSTATSQPGIQNAVISNVTATQVGSPFPIATWANHSWSKVVLNGCRSLGGDFSFDGAGEAGDTDYVIDSVINDHVCLGCRIAQKPLSKRNTFNRPIVANTLDWAFTEMGSTDCVIDGARFYSGGGVNFYTSPSNLIVRNSILYTTNPTAQMFVGQFTKANDGGNNRTVLITPAQFAAAQTGVFLPDPPATQPAH